MAHHLFMDEVRTVVKRFDELGIKYAIRRIRWTEGDHNIFDDMRYEGKDLEWIISKDSSVKANCVYWDKSNLPVYIHANDIIKNKLNKFKDWTCSAGQESLMINWDGDVHRATCRVGDSLGNIYTGTFNTPDAPVTCTRDWCTCAADIPITKFAPGALTQGTSS
jgi:MoaA/NifB/PqqE/SkfB family radical SAM enzyme